MKKEGFSRRQKKIIGSVLILFYCAATVLLCIFVGRPLLEFASEPEQFRSWVDIHGVLGRIAYIGMVILQIVIAAIPGEPLEIGGGYAFGMLEGTVLCILGGVIGSILVFAFVRYFGMKVVELFFSREKIQSMRFLRNSEKRDVLFFFLFLIPGTPKDFLCYFAGLTDMKWCVWLFICSVGRIPSVITSTVGGDALGTQNYMFAAIVFAATIFASLLGVLLYRLICRNGSAKRKACGRRETMCMTKMKHFIRNCEKEPL